MNAAKPSKKARRNYQKHGFCRLKRAIKELGTRAIDRRSTLGKALARWRAELLRDLGGAEAVSTQELVIVDLAVRTKLMLDSVDAWILENRPLVNLRKRALIPVVLQRQQVSDALARYMGVLGLKKRAKPVPALGEYLEERYGGGDSDLSREKNRRRTTETKNTSGRDSL